MSTIQAIDKEIASNLLQMSLIQKKAVLGVIKAIVSEDSDDFDREINRRINEYEIGSVTTYSFEESADRARQAYSKSKNK